MAVNDIIRRMDKLVGALDAQVDIAMHTTGSVFVSDAKKAVTQSIYERITGRTPNRRPWELTGNLRNSIQYNAKTRGDTKVLEFKAGMEYAAAVEARGYDVISGSIPKATQEFERRLKLSMKAAARSVEKL